MTSKSANNFQSGIPNTNNCSKSINFQNYKVPDENIIIGRRIIEVWVKSVGCVSEPFYIIHRRVFVFIFRIIKTDQRNIKHRFR